MVEKEYKMDLHIHTREDITHKTLKYSLRDVIKKAFDNNYKILGFTFHDSTIRHDVEKYFKKGLLLVPGIELTIDNRHILLYSKKFNKYGRSYNYYRNFDKLEKIKDDSLLIGAPHPFYPANYSLRKKTEEYKNLFDFIEWSSVYTNAINFPNKRANIFAKRYDKALLGNSDLHDITYFGYTFTFTDITFEDNWRKTLIKLFEDIRKGYKKYNLSKIGTKPFGMSYFIKFSSKAFTHIVSPKRRKTHAH